ncbi:MAG: hypothetical protein J6R38_00925 [Alistipes sp.]|nr:hypothetical protein [Alistipes sp.]
MRYLTLFFAILIALTASAQRTSVEIIAEQDNGMAYVQGYEYDGGCEFVFKDSCRVKCGRGELNFTMDNDTDVTILLVTDNQKTMHRLTIGPGDSVVLSYTDRDMTIVEDKREFIEEYARFRDIGYKYNDLRKRLYNERCGSRRHKEIEDSIKLLETYYYNEFPYYILNDPEMSKSVYLVHSAIAIRSVAGATLKELDSLRATFAKRLPHAKSFTVRGDKHTERSKRDMNRFNQLLQQN